MLMHIFRGGPVEKIALCADLTEAAWPGLRLTFLKRAPAAESPPGGMLKKMILDKDSKY